MRRLLALFLALCPVPAVAAADPWEDTLDRVVPAVVALRVMATRSFDTEPAAFGRATGFVVDAERGLILTNRHVVRPGPIRAVAVFQNHEEVEVRAIYRDPVHDFGFLRFDPGAVRFMEPGELRLSPRHARVGAGIRVVGNDAGEKLSILAGTLARLDRPAPSYGRGRYNDFNTFYYQAASSTSGGSSGSPAIDVAGRVVALNAGASRRASSSFFLPLDRVVRALEKIRAGDPVTRGTLQTVFEHQPYDQLRRLGLSPATEEALRRSDPAAIGTLVVAEVVPGGSAHGVLRPGDVLLRIDEKPLRDFTGLEAVLDERVGGAVRLGIERGGRPLELDVRVADLHAISPDAYVEMGAAVLHALSYQQARNHAIPLGGVYVAGSGYMLSRAGIPRGAVLTAVGGVTTHDLPGFEGVMRRLPDRARVPVRWFDPATPGIPRVSLVTVDRRWFPMRSCRRDDTAGAWHCVEAPPAPPSSPPAPTTTDLSRGGDGPAKRLGRSLVMVRFDVPYRVDGVHGGVFTGTGLVVDAERGLVVTDRDTVPVALGDVTLTFGGSVEIQASVAFLHPTHNLAVVSYDPALLGETRIESAELEVRSFEPGDPLHLVGLSKSQQLVVRETRVSRVEPLHLPLPTPPRFRDHGLDVLTLAGSAPTLGGVLSDRRGRVLALWCSFSTRGDSGPRSFFAGVPADVVLDVVEPLRAGRTVIWRSLGAELRALSLSEARLRGLSDDAARRLEAHDSARRNVLAVERLVAGAPAAGALQAGDLLLAVNGQPVTSSREVERAAVAERISVAVLRDGVRRDLRFETWQGDGRGTSRIVYWSGAVLQDPPAFLALQRGLVPEGVYVASRRRGSPAERHELTPTHRILAAGDVPTPDLDALLSVLERASGTVRLTTVDLDGRPSVTTLDTDPVDWPAWVLEAQDGDWIRYVPGERRTADAGS